MIMYYKIKRISKTKNIQNMKQLIKEAMVVVAINLTAYIFVIYAITEIDALTDLILNALKNE